MTIVCRRCDKAKPQPGKLSRWLSLSLLSAPSGQHSPPASAHLAVVISPASGKLQVQAARALSLSGFVLRESGRPE